MIITFGFGWGSALISRTRTPRCDSDPKSQSPWGTAVSKLKSALDAWG